MGAVHGEPVSAVNSLLTGKISGNFALSLGGQGAESPELLALAGCDPDLSRHGTGNHFCKSRESQHMNRELNLFYR